jgi:hypothetical protein
MKRSGGYALEATVLRGNWMARPRAAAHACLIGPTDIDVWRISEERNRKPQSVDPRRGASMIKHCSLRNGSLPGELFCVVEIALHAITSMRKAAIRSDT